MPAVIVNTVTVLAGSLMTCSELLTADVLFSQLQPMK